ncbi:hypothetical protein ACFL47_01835 [Candidatus Latescibacterota bacterium]
MTRLLSGTFIFLTLLTAVIMFSISCSKDTQRDTGDTIIYSNTLVEADDPLPILADHAEFVEPLDHEKRFLAPPVIDDDGGTLEVRSWRYWYNARGIIEMLNRLDADATAIINLMAWGVDDGGDISSEQAGIVLSGTPEKNMVFPRQVDQVINPFLKRMSGHVSLVGHTLPGREDDIRKLLYPSMRTNRDDLDVETGFIRLADAFAVHTSNVQTQEEVLKLDGDIPLTSYFLATPSSHATGRYHGHGFDTLPVPLVENIHRSSNDMVFYDGESYENIRDYLKDRGTRHILVMGFIEKTTLLPTHPREGAENADTSVMEKIGTVLDIERLGEDFNIFLVGDTTRTTFPASSTPKYATQTALTILSGDYMITQVNWINMTVK